MGNPESDIRTPIALCLEKLGATEDERYTRCTARSGREQGLAIGLGGAILWCSPEPAACTLWVSRDQRLMALRPEGAPTVSVVRAGRTLELPADKPVVLRHQDDLVFAGVRYRVHVHGTTNEVHPPRRVLALPRVVTLAAVLAAGAACSTPAEPRPPQGEVDAGNPVAEPQLADDPGDASASVIVVDAGLDANASDVIEVRPQPPN